jgi:hypothetical protein
MLSAPSRIPAHDSKVASRPRQAPTAAVGDDVDQRLLPEHDPHRDIGVGPSSQPGDDERALRLRTREGLVAKRGITGVAAVAAMLNVVCSGLAYSVGGISWLEHAVVIVPTMYFMCICIHDGCHFMLTPYRWLTDVLGFCLSLFLAIPFPLLRASHLTHHKHFGTDLDPESVAGLPPPLSFGVGPRSCIGGRASFVTAHRVLSALLARYDVALTPAEAKERPLIFGLKRAGGFMARLKQRA